MRHWLAILLCACVFVIGAAVGVTVTSRAGYTGFSSQQRAAAYLNNEADAIPPQSVQNAGPTPRPNALGFAPILKPALPAVVSILSSRVVNVPQNPLFNNPFFQQFFGGQVPQPPQQQREEGLGSGVIVTPDGYILTNNHVVAKSTDIKVMLPDKRQFPGKVIGTDPQTDIAVVKINATNLPTLTFGDSSKLQVGDYAFAIGNPFGVGETATMGIISATGRNNLSIEDYEDFIQTDAAINPGNSGGPLLNVYGQVIGINTAILSGGSGGNQGIGFAIPINMAKYVMEQILKHGKVVRGYIGIGIQEVTPALAKAFNVPPEKGALISSVEPDSPGAKAGLQRGDVIVELDGQPVTGPNTLRLKVATLAPGSVVHLKLLRNGQPKDVTLTLGESPSSKAAANAGAPAEHDTLRGIQVDQLTPDVRQQLGLGANVKGVVVTNIANNSPAADSALQPGDVIEQINRQPVNSVSDYDRLATEAGNEPAVLLINRKGNTVFVVVQPE
jgi:serine protease Do